MSERPLPRAGLLEGGVHRFPVRIYYEDTDAAGIVYYANYLKFVERARTEMMRLFGIEHEAGRQADGTAFIVRRAEIEYLASARLDDEIVIETRLREIGGASILLDQDVMRGPTLLVRSTILVACIGAKGRPTRLPSALRAALSAYNETSQVVTAHAR